MKTIKQQVFINATPREVYEAYVDAKKHAVFTGANVKFEAKAGGKFDIWDGELIGENVKLVPGKKIVQKWRANDWPEGHYSDLKIELFGEGDGRRPGGRSGSEGTKLKLTHSCRFRKRTLNKFIPTPVQILYLLQLIQYLSGSIFCP